MNEEIIFSNRINQTEFLRSLSRLNKCSFNIRIYNSFSLASEALERSNYVINKSLIQKEDEVFKYINIIDSEHFKSYLDVYHLASTIRNVRLLLTSENELEELKAKLKDYISEDNISLIIDIFNKYLKDNSFIDYISYLRLAIKHAKKAFKEIIVFKEENISPLEKLLINELSINVKEMSLVDYIGVKEVEPLYKDINPYYGVDNEVEEVISRIYESKYKLDETNIVLTCNTDYVNSLFRIMNDKQIPMTFSKGLPITLSNAYKLYASFLELERVDKFDVNGYKKLFNNECFDKSKFNYLELVLDVLGRMKISFDKDLNSSKFQRFNECKNRDAILNELCHIYDDKDIFGFISELQMFIDDMSKGILHVLNKYLYKNNEFDDIALEHINDVIIQSELIKDKNIKNSYLDSVNGLYICMSASKEGAINVTLLNNAFSTIRKHNFILGLNANNFPGKRVENYLINDDELKAINIDAITSDKKILLKNNDFDNFAKLNTALGNDIYLSYSFFNLIETNSINPSSKIFEIVSKTKKDDYLKELKEKTNYFSSKINPLKKVGDAYLNNKQLKLNEETLNFKLDTNNLFDRTYYPSDIDVFFDCEMKFYITKILKIKEVNEHNRYQIIDGGHFGTLLHYLMKQHNYLDEDNFLKKTEEIFNDYLTFNYPLVKFDEDFNEFKKCALNGYRYLKKFTDFKFEEKIESKYNKLLLGGRYDCLAKKDGKYVLIDFKSNKSIKRNSEDPSTIRQLLIYSKILNENNIDVLKGEYFYFRYNREIEVEYNKNNLFELENDLKTFIMALETRTFKGCKDDNICRYCPLNNFCNLKEKHHD